MKKQTKNSSKPKKRKQNIIGLSFVKDLNDLKSLLAEGYYEFRIALGGTGGALFSRKYIYYYPKEKEAFQITNCIDDTKQSLTEKELMDKSYTNIGDALTKGSLIVDLTEKS